MSSISESFSSLNITNYISLNGGDFYMGSPEYEHERKDWEILHEVRIENFHICKYAVSVNDFKTFIDDTKYLTDAELNGGSNSYNGIRWITKLNVNWRHGVGGRIIPFLNYNHPVVHVSWNDACEFCKWLSQKINLKICLPTEAQWEYACRSGTSSPFSFGDNIHSEYVNYHGFYPFYPDEIEMYRQNTVPVDSFEPNLWGLYCMHGNTYEWCKDWYRKEYYQECLERGLQFNPIDELVAEDRVLRGGSWWSGAKYCRSGSRYGHPPVYSDDDTGFRPIINF
jgi:formylglycine-generating enzyme